MKICPNCGSVDIEQDTSSIIGSIGVTPTAYICNNCKRSSEFFPEIIPEKVEEYRKELKKFKESEENKKTLEEVQERVDTRYSKFVLKIERFSCFVLLIVGVILTALNTVFFPLLLGSILCLLVLYKNKIWR